jgi:hypothetical protein
MVLSGTSKDRSRYGGVTVEAGTKAALAMRLVATTHFGSVVYFPIAGVDKHGGRAPPDIRAKMRDYVTSVLAEKMKKP